MKKYTEEGSDFIRASIGNAVFDLLQSTPFDEIKVIDIYRRAAVGKTTFYRYFGSKNGKMDALYASLKWGFAQYKAQHPTLIDPDEQFSAYLFSIREKLLLLHRENCMEAVDRLTLFLFQPESPKSSKSIEDPLLYVKYMKAGIWMGFIRALIATEFCDEPAVVKQKIQEGMRRLLENAIA